MQIEKKVIFIEGTELHKSKNYPSRDSDEFYLASWGGMFSRRLAKRFPGYDVSVWRAELDTVKINKRVTNGVHCQLYPYKGRLMSVLTMQMLIELRRLSKNYHLVVCRSDLFDWIFVILLAIFVPRASIVVFHHGGKFEHPRTLKKCISYEFLKLSYSKIDTATYLRHDAKDWMLALKKHPSLVWLPVGADFSVFTPQDKQACRKELGLEPHKIYAVYVGRMFRLKGVDVILDLYEKYKGLNFEVLFVGANERDELYEDVKISGTKFWHRVDWLLLSKIYSAADFYIHPAFHPNFGGLDTSLMECLACGTPVLSPQLAEYDFESSELGICVNSFDKFDNKLQEMMKSFDSYKMCREVAIKHLDGNGQIIDKLYSLFENVGCS